MYRLKFFSTTRFPEGEDLELFPMPTFTHDGMKRDKINRMTTVILLEDDDQIAITTVTRYFKDPDIPVLGQKLAVEQLLKENNFNKKTRTEVWETFWNHSKKSDSFRHGAYKNEISHIKQEDAFRNWTVEMMRK